MVQKKLPPNFNMTDLSLLFNDYDNCPYVVVSKRTFIDIKQQVYARSKFSTPLTGVGTYGGNYTLKLFGLKVVWDDRAPNESLTFSPTPEYQYDPFEEWVNEVRSGDKPQES